MLSMEVLSRLNRAIEVMMLKAKVDPRTMRLRRNTIPDAV
jgi:hypothetical protein